MYFNFTMLSGEIYQLEQNENVSITCAGADNSISVSAFFWDKELETIIHHVEFYAKSFTLTTIKIDNWLLINEVVKYSNQKKIIIA